MKNRAAGYVRVSRLRENDPGISPDNQKEKILLQAKLMGIPEENVDFYSDLDYSGKNANRPEFQRMMSNLDNYSHVIVYKFARFMRSAIDFYENIIKLERAGVALVSVTENCDTSKPVGRIIRGILIEVAEMERENISEQVRDNMKINAGKGNWNGGAVPYGFEWVEEDKSLVLNNYFENVISIFETIATGYGAPAIIQNFYAKGVKSPTGRDKWSKNTIYGIVRNPVYKGMIRYGGVVHKGHQEQGITDELWDKANRMLNYRGKQPARGISSSHLLSGMVVCPLCGRNLNVRYNGRSHTMVRRYVCPNRNDYIKGHKCSCQVLDADSLEAAATRKLLQMAKSPKYIENAIKVYNSHQPDNGPDLAARKTELLNRLKKIKTEMEDMFRLYRKKIITETQLDKQNAGLLKQEAIIQKELDDIEHQTKYNVSEDEERKYFRTLITNLDQIWNYANIQERRLLLQVIVKQVLVTKNGVELDCQYFKVPIKYSENNKTTMWF